jgi:hypothetical protein
VRGRVACASPRRLVRPGGKRAKPGHEAWQGPGGFAQPGRGRAAWQGRAAWRGLVGPRSLVGARRVRAAWRAKLGRGAGSRSLVGRGGPGGARETGARSGRAKAAWAARIRAKFAARKVYYARPKSRQRSGRSGVRGAKPAEASRAGRSGVGAAKPPRSPARPGRARARNLKRRAGCAFVACLGRAAGFAEGSGEAGSPCPQINHKSITNQSRINHKSITNQCLINV